MREVNLNEIIASVRAGNKNTNAERTVLCFIQMDTPALRVIQSELEESLNKAYSSKKQSDIEDVHTFITELQVASLVIGELYKPEFANLAFRAVMSSVSTEQIEWLNTVLWPNLVPGSNTIH